MAAIIVKEDRLSPDTHATENGVPIFLAYFDISITEETTNMFSVQVSTDIHSNISQPVPCYKCSFKIPFTCMWNLDGRTVKFY